MKAPKQIFKIYLSGPITGLTLEQTQEWRNYVSNILVKEKGFFCYSPLRYKDYLKNMGKLTPTFRKAINPLSKGAAPLTRDYYDTVNSDLVLVNLLGAKDKSLGTIAEMAWAYAFKIPMIIVMEKEGNPHDHCFMHWTPWIVETLDEAIYITKAILTTGENEL